MSFCPACQKAHDKTETRAHILAMAKRMFEVLGYDEVTLKAVAEGVGCSTGSIFFHWKSKDALFLEAIGRPHLTDARGAELLEALKLHAPEVADELLKGWSA